MKKFIVHSVEILPGDRVSHALTGARWAFDAVESYNGHDYVAMLDGRSAQHWLFRPEDFGGSVVEVSD